MFVLHGDQVRACSGCVEKCTQDKKIYDLRLTSATFNIVWQFDNSDDGMHEHVDERSMT